MGALYQHSDESRRARRALEDRLIAVVAAAAREGAAPSALERAAGEWLPMEVRQAMPGVSRMECARLVEVVLDEVFRLGPLEPLLRDPAVAGIRVMGAREALVYRKGVEVRTNVRFDDIEHMQRKIDRLVRGARANGSLEEGGGKFEGVFRGNRRFLIWQSGIPGPPRIEIVRMGAEFEWPDTNDESWPNPSRTAQLARDGTR